MRALSRHESQYARSLIEASLDPLVTISTKGKITDMNEALANVTGLTREQLTDTDFFEYFTEPQKAREVYQEIFAMGSVADSPLTLRHGNGKLTDVLFNGSVYKDGRGNVLGVVVVARDVTEQKRIATELTVAKVAAEKASKVAEVAKIKAEDAAIIAETATKKAEDAAIIAETATKKAEDATIRAESATGKAEDATKIAESATKIAEDATKIAEDATKIAEDAVKAKQQFLSNMSHEIRTPMNAIIGFTKVLLKTELSAKQKEFLTAIKMSGDALIVLINDILDLAKVDSGKMTFEKTPFRMSLSISAMLHLFQTKILEKNLVLIKEYDENIPDVLVGDAVRLHQIILNLVSNSVKFTSKGKITVSVKMLSQDDEKVTIEFSVSDTGIGIVESKMENIFENFQQATSDTSRLYGGTGLGLAIVKQLVETQGGTVRVKSKVGEG
ncbi:MAG TPA: ATP-binding protein, partial [Bacteroidales bacterium]